MPRNHHRQPLCIGRKHWCQGKGRGHTRREPGEICDSSFSYSFLSILLFVSSGLQARIHKTPASKKTRGDKSMRVRWFLSGVVYYGVLALLTRTFHTLNAR